MIFYRKKPSKQRKELRVDIHSKVSKMRGENNAYLPVNHGY